ncbi:YdiU family protein [Oceanicola sp. 502str15]|uniref:protein adenylyltransferase SelO n=1 Tax=Oceanicola sp. 502str15 TaxID=2696061 RepID=UPI002094976B|nr:YdiU family protein [Oceanicola sp. 502str15]MCO6382431.1 YdiU family protein [Oceanicola sp. 502str15]
MHLPLAQSYATLGPQFFRAQPAEPVAAPELLLLNEALARSLTLDPEALKSPEGLALLSGNEAPAQHSPIAQAYAGHQFGGWSPQLGDGRALLLGDITTPEGTFDLQLKGSGRTPFSRNGDGRAWLGPVLREYIVSEAMQALGVPTTRALAAVATGERVQRERAYPGAILTRVAASHIRVGTFQYFAARNDVQALEALTAFALKRHYPEAEGPMGLLSAVVAAQARLIAHWMSLGFIHGVMNTDNMAISGQTIDYGPCAFIDAYHPQTVYSSIDRMGRYAYDQQAQIGGWNLAQLASALLPIMGGEEAIPEATERVNAFRDIYQAEYLARFGAKLGLAEPTAEDLSLVTGLLEIMATEQADFTNTFRALTEGHNPLPDSLAFAAWHGRWQALAPSLDLMKQANPALIPRNHRIEQAIEAAVAGDLAPTTRLIQALATPFDPPEGTEDLRLPPLPEEEVQATFCGT